MLDFSENLKLLCTYTNSISETTRKIGLNRQQFHRYLNGTSQPSRKNMQKICDYFGVEVSEVYLSHDDFKQLLAVKKPKIANMDPLGEYVAKLNVINPSSTSNLTPYLGYYFAYYKSNEFPNMVTRALVKVFERNGFVYTKSIENFSLVQRSKRQIQKYNGVVLHTGDKLVVFERENSLGKMMWNIIFHAVDIDQAHELSGLTMGVSGNIIRDIACCRVVWERIRGTINLRKSLQQCGVFPVNDPMLPEDIVQSINNNIVDNEVCFLARK